MWITSEGQMVTNHDLTWVTENARKDSEPNSLHKVLDN